MNAQLKKGVLELVVLESVRQRDMYGYELVEEVSKVVDVNEGTIYPLLKRLTNERYFETYLRESTEGPPRKYYHLTAAGVLYRDTLEKEWSELTEKVGAFWRDVRMDKNTFMRELERSLSVLQESELRDILSEYEQHIDMKVKSGLSEEEAIADFGSIPELTAEILEPTMYGDFGPGQRDGDGWRAAEDGRNDGDGSSEDQGDGEKERRAAETWKARAAGFFSELGRRAARLVRRAGRWVSDVFVFWREFLGRLSGGFPGSGSRGRRSSCI